MKKPPLATIHGEPSLEIGGDCVRAWLTPRCGMLAPVEFDLGGRIVRPYSLPPWTPAEAPESEPPILQVLRGDFFCFPFGVSPGIAGVHGPTANATWTIASAEPSRAVLTLEPAAPAASVRKTVSFRPGETNVYQEHVVRASGRFNYGHHPIIHVPEGVTAEVRTSPFRFGAPYPGNAVRSFGERGALPAEGRFSALDSAPLDGGGTTSLARYPVRPGTEDIVMMAGFPGPYAWSALTLDGWVWFALRRTADFPGTLFWMTNGGRTHAPWNGTHTRRIGVEDVCSHFCDGLDVSTRDLLAAEGIATARSFDPAVPVRLPHVQGVVAVPPDFGGVASLEPAAGDRTRAVLRSESGGGVEFPLDWPFFGETSGGC
jgi:hypothetical protein